ncbi:MAG TPA: CDP-alcohol phosphatidyltransferase family protein [Nocardioides sp.]|nr:CDP-alcohol phosphatidyltransferase family protein [Nocardioides sp.]
MRRVHLGRLGPADLVTLARALIGVGVAMLVVRSFGTDVPTSWVVAPAAVAVALDAVDGWVARRTGTVSSFGARFDMETDAALLLVLSTYVARDVGVWVLAIGLARYVFLAAKAPLPWLRGQAPPRAWCKVVAALQGVVLLVAASGLLPEPIAVAALLVALALLVESFAHEAWDLWRVRQPHRPQPWVTRLTGLLACLVVWAVLVAPDEVAAVSPAAFARIPLEGLVLVGLGLLLPSRPAVWLATGAGLALGVLTLLKLLDLGVSVAFARRFDPLGDPVYVGAGVSFLRDAMGTANAWTATVLAAGLMVAVLVLVPYAVLRATRLARGHRPIAGPVVVALSVVWVGCAVAGVRVAPGEPVAATTAVDLASTHVTEVRDRLRERAALAAQIADDDFADVPPSRLLRALRGKDVLLVFVESYGQVALEGLPTSSQLRDSVDAHSRRLEAAGYRSRSAYLTSPTFGAMSWLAHSTLQSGLWIDNQGTYDLLLDRDRLTLSSAFGKAGWRSVGMIPADTEPWPEGQRFYRWEALHDMTNMDYEGPRFGYGRMPDQFALESFRRLELDRPGRGPVMAEIDLESSHNPWVPLPRMVDPDELGDGSVFEGMPEEGQQRDDVWRDADLVKAAYVRSLQYSLDALTEFVERSNDEDLVLVVLGDHWPVTTVSGTTPGHDVPISVIANDPAVLRRIDAWGWQDGLRPQSHAQVWPMDAFRDRFLEAFSR